MHLLCSSENEDKPSQHNKDLRALLCTNHPGGKRELNGALRIIICKRKNILCSVKPNDIHVSRL